MELAIIGTDTGVGKTWVTTLLAAALRATGRRVWIHKPMACGGWLSTGASLSTGAETRHGSAEDARALRAICGDGQPPQTVCPLEFPEPCSPHLAAAAVGKSVSLQDLDAGFAACRGAEHDVLVEGIGGLLTPLTSQRESFAELLPRWQVPAVLVTRPDLGTLNHTALTVRVARASGIRVLGLIMNLQRPPVDSLAERTAVAELTVLTGLPVLAIIQPGADHRTVGPALLQSLRACEPPA